MAVNNIQTVQQTQNRPSVQSQIGAQAANMAMGAVAGGAAGGVISLATPVSKKKIVAQVVDHFSKNNECNVQNAAEELKGLELRNNFSKLVEEFSAEAKGMSDENFDVKTVLKEKGLDKLFEKFNISAPEDGMTKNDFVKYLDRLAEGSKVDNLEEKRTELNEILAEVTKKAEGAVNEFFGKTRKARQEAASETDKLVKMAKKAAKKVQNGKIIGTAILVGVFMAAFSDLLPKLGSNNKNNIAAQENESPARYNKMGTHQG